jgi:hypothetical protein
MEEILSQVIPVHTLKRYLFMIQFNIIIPFMIQFVVT